MPVSVSIITLSVEVYNSTVLKKKVLQAKPWHSGLQPRIH